MLFYYDRIDLGERTEVAKSNYSKECMICHYQFFYYGFKFQDSVCNISHDLMTFCFNMSDSAIINVESVDCNCIIHDIRKTVIIHLLKNSVFDDRGFIQNAYQKNEY